VPGILARHGALGDPDHSWHPGDAALAERRRVIAHQVSRLAAIAETLDGERLMARLFKEAGRRAVLSTKVPPKNMEWPGHPRAKLALVFPPDWVRLSVERSLRNLGTDGVDLYQFHVWHDSWLKDPMWPALAAEMEKLKSEGKVRNWGVSINNDDPDSALELVKTGLVGVVHVAKVLIGDPGGAALQARHQVAESLPRRVALAGDHERLGLGRKLRLARKRRRRERGGGRRRRGSRPSRRRSGHEYGGGRAVFTAPLLYFSPSLRDD